MKKVNVVLSVLLTVGLLLTATPAFADSPSASAAPGDCWSDLTNGHSICVPAGGDLAGAVKKQYDVDMVVESSPGQSTDLITGQTFATPTSLSAAKVTPAASYVLIKLYIDANYGGDVWAVSASGPCFNDGTPWGIADFGASSPSSGYWNNRTSSYQSFHNCTSTLFDNANYSGDSTGYAVNRASLGTMNDRANSAIMKYNL